MTTLFTELGLPDTYQKIGEASLPSRFDVSGFANDTIACAGTALSALVAALGLRDQAPIPKIDARLASLWFKWSFYPIGWKLPPVWDEFSGLYETRDGWIRVHTNVPAHRAAALRVLGSPSSRSDANSQARSWRKHDLESAIAKEGGASAAYQSRNDWLCSPQGMAIASEPLIEWSEHHSGEIRTWSPQPKRPLAGLKILDLTRVLAGPVSTRFLAGFGADVLRIDPPDWDEGAVVPEVTLGKKCARLDLKTSTGKETLKCLLSKAHVLVHGYRADALDRLGFGDEVRRASNPGLIDVSLNAYGWRGPWKHRRGFDSLVQMSSGIAHDGMLWANETKPYPLPTQALDHGTGYLMAYAVLMALEKAVRGESVCSARLSLARTGHALTTLYDRPTDEETDVTLEPEDFQDTPEESPWGPANRLRPPLTYSDLDMRWDLPSCLFGSSHADW